MQLDDSTTRQLKSYLLQSLESIADTDVQMLADYIVALLKHDKPPAELKAVCLEQLADFLGPNTAPFVEKLFQFLPSLGASQPQMPQQPTPQPHPFSQQTQQVSSGWSPPDKQAHSSKSQGQMGSDQGGYDNRRFQQRENYQRDYSYGEDNGGESRRFDDRQMQFRRSGGAGGEGSRPVSARLQRTESGWSDGNRGSGSGRTSPQFQQPQQQKRQQGGWDRTNASFNGNGKPPQQQRRERCERVEITHIPAYHVNQQEIVGYFSRFGRILRLSMQPEREAVLLEFSTVDEAGQCVSSLQAPFNNRFIRIMFYNNQWPTHNSIDLTAGADLPRILSVEEKRAKQEQADRLRAEMQQKMAELQRQQELERQRLVAKLNEVSETDRQQILGALGDVSKTIASTAQQQQYLDKLSKLAAAKQQYLQQKQQMAAGVGEASADLLEQISKMPGETTEDLQAQLDFLKQQHAQLGAEAEGMMISPSANATEIAEFAAATAASAASSTRGSWRGGRGGRARGRGRGATSYHPYTRASAANKLDLRPRSLLATQIPPSMSEPLLKQHFGKFGVVSGMNSRPDGSAVVTFAARWLAEKALQNAGQLEDGSTLQLDWWTGPAVAINGTEMEQQASNEMEVTMDV